MVFISTTTFGQAIEWLGSQIFTDFPYKPSEDATFYKWYETSYDDNSWTIVKLPDEKWNCNECDRYYRGYFEIDAIDLNNINYYLSFESDDGIWIYLNGQYIGHWGGDTHQSKCVNRCNNKDRVDPIYVNSQLTTGENVVAIHVSDDKQYEYFDLKISTRDKKNSRVIL